MNKQLHRGPRTPTEPALRAFAITPSDAAYLPSSARSIYVGSSGDLVVTMAGGGNAVTFRAVPAGTVLPVQVVRVHAAGTTASDLVALL